MNVVNSWEAETIELINRFEREIREMQDDTSQRVSILEQKKKILEDALRVYVENAGSRLAQSIQLLSSKDVANKSYREILRLIAQRNDGILMAKTAVKLMKEANVFGNPLNADSVVYAVLKRSPDFVKIGKGVYRLNGGRKQKIHVKTRRTKSKLHQAIKELKKNNPQMTKKQVKNTLIRLGFDFQGKNAGQAVHMAWVNLGYAKKEAHQTPLLTP